MHFPTILASLLTVSGSMAAAVKQEENVGVAMMTYNGDESLPLNVPFGVLSTNKGVKVTELEIVNVYSSVKGVKPPKADQVTCQAYKDQWGTIPVSKDFTAKKSAVISTKPAAPVWVLCRVNASNPDTAISTPPIRYRYIPEVETIDDYRPGGYHPIQINDSLHDDRYRIVHKLGHGSFSTVWLALDQESSEYVAVKVGTAEADRHEADILCQLATASIEEPSIHTVIDQFIIDGPNGKHPCFVTTPARCSLTVAKEESDSRLFQLEVAHSLAAQLVTAVAHVHSHGYAHGDLHLGNLTLRLPASLNSLTVERFYAKFGAPEPEPVVGIDGMSRPAPGIPSHVFAPVWLGIVSDELPLHEAKLLLSDFGVTFRPEDESRFQSNAPLVVRPPESYFDPNTPLTLKSDIWSLGCLIFELFAHRSLIDGIIAPQDDIMAQQVHLQGPLPLEWWSTWKERPKWFDTAGKPLSKECDIWSWERRFDQWIEEPRQFWGMDSIWEEEKAAFLDLLKRMLAWKPTDRPSATERTCEVADTIN
ncbi:hypothetical protein KAF25_007726 [Fusarium avenaceum]|uniref:non-specific serine/threonine protein kinase n=1 Tax=Fusarium avenaceum TaxID=40199 RepID=A0A9P7H0F0_9HYPO|nr:hypothetical protein KAF25_007726 [Fusarium avenaceum]